MSSSNRPPATTELRQKSVYSRNNQQSSSSGASLESMRASLEVALLYLSDAVARTLTAPFSRTKVVLQTQHLAIPASGLPYTNGVNALREQWLREGRHGFWKGNLAHILRGPLLSWSSSYTFLKLQSWLQPTGTTKPIHSRTLLAACLAGATTGALEYPLQHARNLLAADLSPKGSKPQYTGIWDALWQTGRGHGVLSLYRGLGIGMVGNGLQILVRLPVFDALARAGGVDGIGTGEPKAWMRLGVAVAATVVGHWVACGFPRTSLLLADVENADVPPRPLVLNRPTRHSPSPGPPFQHPGFPKPLPRTLGRCTTTAGPPRHPRVLPWGPVWSNEDWIGGCVPVSVLFCVVQVCRGDWVGEIELSFGWGWEREVGDWRSRWSFAQGSWN